jgi:hypothetical protein
MRLRTNFYNVFILIGNESQGENNILFQKQIGLQLHRRDGQGEIINSSCFQAEKSYNILKFIKLTRVMMDRWRRIREFIQKEMVGCRDGDSSNGCSAS